MSRNTDLERGVRYGCLGAALIWLGVLLVLAGVVLMMGAR